jgi:hypothetical protein
VPVLYLIEIASQGMALRGAIGHRVLQPPHDRTPTNPDIEGHQSLTMD